jgi:subtilisin family serine protease
MKRIVSFIVLFALILGLFSAAGSTDSVYAKSNSGLDTVDVIIQTDGSSMPVAKSLKRLGGMINYSYKNVPVLAATIPGEVVQEVIKHPNVVKVAKDRLVFLSDDGNQEDETRPMHYTVKDLSATIIKSSGQAPLSSAHSPKGYASFLYSRAGQIWQDTSSGNDSVVAVVDTGTVPNVCLAHAVTGAPGYPEGYNATGDGIPATDPRNNWHGTHVGGIIASACKLDFREDLSDPLYQAISTYLPWQDGIVPVYGQAPNAQVYPVKVFETDGGGSPISVILDGLDHLLTLKSENLLDIDVVNLSFGGPTWYDGRDILDTFLAKFREQNILVVAAAGNGGPLPNSIASPATSVDSIAVGALDYAASSRAFYEYLGLIWEFGPGQGMVMRPTGEIRVANMSSRGPMSDGRFGPDISAPGMWSFQFGPINEPRWDSGTSYSAAVVSGTAALLNAYYEKEHGQDTPWLALRNSILLGADFDIVGERWQDINAVGYGALDAEAAMQIFKTGATQLNYPIKTGRLRADILGNPMSGDRQVFESGTVSLNPGESYDLVFEIASATSKVNIQVYDITTPDNFTYAFWPNSLKVQIQSAKRTEFPLPIDQYWDPHLSENEFTIEIQDGLWTMAGTPVTYQPMEPGLMKASLIGDFANESPISFKMRVTREKDSPPKPDRPIAMGTLNMGDTFNLPVEIPDGVNQVTFDLVWNRDWRKFPTSDLDLLVFDPAGNLVSLDGATGNTPERAVIIDPVPGTWTICIEAIEVYKTDLFRLFLKNSTSDSQEMINHLVPPFDIIAQHPSTDPFSGTADDSATPYIIWLPILP